MGFKGVIVPLFVSTERVGCGEEEAAGRNGVSTSVRLVFAKCYTACTQCMTKYWEDGGDDSTGGRFVTVCNGSKSTAERVVNHTRTG